MSARPGHGVCFVVPALGGPITGGTLYNRELLGALRALGDVQALELGSPGLDRALEAARFVWVDSLYLGSVPDLKRRAAGRLGLLAHYLPSFVAFGRAAAASELSVEEARAVECADAFWVTSAFMRDACEALVAPKKKPILVVAPGTDAELSSVALEHGSELRAVLVGNVTAGKGIEVWLHALESALRSDDRLRVTIAGSLVAEPEYAERCVRFVRESPLLAERAVFRGAIAHEEVRALLAHSNLFVSASRMESYGMALAEARVTGLPVLARSGGNAAAHVDERAGGELVANEAELAEACVRLARDEGMRHARAVLARERAPLARSWARAAEEFAAQCAAWEK